VGITTQCAHCGRPLHIEMDSKLKYQVTDEGAEPLVFLPDINWATFGEPNIIDAY
jgi:hypothetical protein